jgi:hypothetical protein
LQQNVIDVIDRRAVEESADYIEKSMTRALALRSREELWALGLRDAKPEGLFLEFGVFKGYSANYFAKHLNNEIWGFDSFEGLQEDWVGTAIPKGTLDLKGRLPKVRSNVRLIKGWFDETLPDFLRQHPHNISLLHLDCDSYVPTRYVLNECKTRLTADTIIILDDYHGFRGWKLGQFQAWSEFVAENKLTYEYIAFNRHACMLRLVVSRS